ncbi:hypothetical protein NJC38_02935 [Pseudomonas sp. 21LCFQ010]|nr:hypothetical protein [Pseudomonas sp. 21LCFQ010]MCO8161107.1 hypothetical protein [Pseudomonas sp. 21LCFQ010]
MVNDTGWQPTGADDLRKRVLLLDWTALLVLNDLGLVVQSLSSQRSAFLVVSISMVSNTFGERGIEWIWALGRLCDPLESGLGQLFGRHRVQQLLDDGHFDSIDEICHGRGFCLSRFTDASVRVLLIS